MLDLTVSFEGIPFSVMIYNSFKAVSANPLPVIP